MTTTISINGASHEVPRTLASQLGWQGSSFTPESERLITEAISEGLSGETALIRAIAIRNQRNHEETITGQQIKTAETLLHAARVERQAAMLRCRAANVSERI